MQQPVDQRAEQVVKDRKQRYADDHSHKAPQGAEPQNGKHDPDGRQAHGISEDLRAQEVPVKLLQHDHIDEENDSLDRRDREDQDRGRDRPMYLQSIIIQKI